MRYRVFVSSSIPIFAPGHVADYVHPFPSGCLFLHNSVHRCVCTKPARHYPGAWIKFAAYSTYFRNSVISNISSISRASVIFCKKHGVIFAATSTRRVK